MRSVRVLALLVCVGLTMTAGAGTAAGAKSGPRPHLTWWSAKATSDATVFTDPASDVVGGPDLTTVSVHDDSQALLYFDVTIGGTQAIGADDYVDILLNTDENVGTGSPFGAEYDLALTLDSGEWLADLYQWVNDQWVSTGAADTVKPPAGATFSAVVSRTDLGNPPAIDFYAIARSYDGVNDQVLSRDDAPDYSWWRYTPSFVLPPSALVKPVLSAGLSDPVKIVAGERVTVSNSVTRSDNGEPMTNADVAGLVVVNGSPVKLTHTFKNGILRLSFLVPKSAKGKAILVLTGARTCCQVTTRLSRFTVG
jgi:hypothetical protein